MSKCVKPGLKSTDQKFSVAAFARDSVTTTKSRRGKESHATASLILKCCLPQMCESYTHTHTHKHKQLMNVCAPLLKPTLHYFKCRQTFQICDLIKMLDQIFLNSLFMHAHNQLIKKD